MYSAPFKKHCQGCSLKECCTAIKSAPSVLVPTRGNFMRQAVASAPCLMSSINAPSDCRIDGQMGVAVRAHLPLSIA